jgi:serine/tyrosine/threonine adenylyltransferase
MTKSSNPLLNLNYEPALESLGDDYYDQVVAAEFPQHILRFRNDDILTQIGLDSHTVTDDDFITAFGKFQDNQRPFLALRYHGYQFGEYNSRLGDGRGFLYGQIRGLDKELYDFGTKGSGNTPYSRSADGRLTLKGGVREVLAAEMLHQMGVKTSRCFSLIETGESLWRGDEPSPTRSSVMVRFSLSHIRFGTFERLHYLGRKDLIEKLLNHVIDYYYPHLTNQVEKYILFYTELVQRVAKLTAQWMAAGFCHAVLNTDNMSITGESFDYGPYAFIPTYNPDFTAAYFDYYGRYSYGNQPDICRLNLKMLQVPLRMIINSQDLENCLYEFDTHYVDNYKRLMCQKLGLTTEDSPSKTEFLKLTFSLLAETQVSYHHWFAELTNLYNNHWSKDVNSIFIDHHFFTSVPPSELLNKWRGLYHSFLLAIAPETMINLGKKMRKFNPQTPLLRPEIEAIWQAIAEADNWQPFYDLLNKIRSGL